VSLSEQCLVSPAFPGKVSTATPLVLTLMMLMPFLALVAWFWTAGDGPVVDDSGLYLMHAEAVIAGRPYAETSYFVSGNQVAPGAQPPGLPLTLAAVMTLTGGYHPVAIKIVMVLLAIPFILLPGLYFGRTHGFAVGGGVSMFLGVGQAWMSMRVLTDLGFAGLVWALIWVLDRTDVFRWRHVFAVLALGSAAMAYRVLGGAIVPTVALFALLNRRRLGFRPAVPAVLWILGAVVALTVIGGWGRILREVGWIYPGFPGYVVRHLRTSFLVPAAESHLHPFSGSLANDVFHVASLSIAGVALIAWARRNWRSAAFLFTICYVGALLSTWAQSGRYLIPLQPLLLFGLVAGIQELITRARSGLSVPTASRATLAVTGVIVLLGTINLLREPRPRDHWSDASTVELVRYLQEAGASEPDMRVMAPRPRVLGWKTGIPTTGTIDYFRTEDTMTELERLAITHVVVGDPNLGRDARGVMTKVRLWFPCRFETVFRNETYTVHRMISECPT